MMTIGQLSKELQELGVKRFCFRVRHQRYEAMIVNEDGDVFGIADDTIEEAAQSLLAALRTKELLGHEGWGELLNPNLN
jgi:hypothetical protein